MNDENDLRKLLGEARAIHLTMKLGGISYKEAKLCTKPLLQRINTAIELIGKKHKVKSRNITFQNLGENL